MTIIIIGGALWLCRYGMDFTDEGFYLVWAADPFIYSASSTQFGFVYHPLYLLLGGDIALLRQANMLLTVGSAGVLVYATLQTLHGKDTFSRYQHWSISAGLGVAVLLVFQLWLPTPNYNSLAMQALCLATSGLIWSSKDSNPGSLRGWLLVGVGEWLLFLAKPTSALAFACFATIYVIFARKLRPSLIAMSILIATSLLILSALLMDGSIQAFVSRLRDGAQMYAILGAGHASLLRLEPLTLDPAVRQALWIMTAAATVVIALNGMPHRAAKAGGAILLLCVAALSCWILFGMPARPFQVGTMQELIVASIPFGMVLAGLALHRLKTPKTLTSSGLALALLLIALPYAFVFGTNGNYWGMATRAAIFWVLGGLVFLRFPSDPARTLGVLLASAFCMQALTVAQLHNATAKPYRQAEALSQQHTPITLPGTGSRLLLGTEYGRYVDSITNLAKMTGFPNGTPVIDLSGHSPMVLHIMAAKSIGQPWTVGGYAGSNDLATWMLARVDCDELAEAWLLVEPEGPRKLQAGPLLSAFGADYDTDYTTVGHLRTPSGKGGFSDSFRQELRKPTRQQDQAKQACQTARTHP